MMLPSDLAPHNEWVFLGPMGPALPEDLSRLPIIAVDGGGHFIQDAKVWIGDGDSLLKEINSDVKIKLSPDKDNSDLAGAFSLLTEPRHYKLHLWGFLGGRRDHELFNLGEALHFLDNNQECQVLFYNSQGKLVYHALGAGHWKFHHHGIFSLGTIKKTSVSLTGACKYPLKESHPLHPLSSLGLSNEARGEVALTAEGAVFIYFKEDL